MKQEAEPDDSNEVVMDVSYEMTTFRDFDIPPSSNYSKLDYSAMNPKSEKQKIHMQLLENGQMNMTIEEIYDFEGKVEVKHHILPDPSPKLVKTVIRGGTISYHDESGEVITSPFSPPDYSELINQIKSLGETLTNDDRGLAIISKVFRRQKSSKDNSIEELIKNASKYNIKVTEMEGDLIILRKPMSLGDKGEGEQVLLVDKKEKKMLASRVYGADGILLHTAYYGYDPMKKNSLVAIKFKEKVSLPSGRQAMMITNLKIDGLQYKLN